MAKKKLSGKMKNHIRTYLNDEEHLSLMRRMNEEGVLGVAAYVRRLIVLDAQKRIKA